MDFVHLHNHSNYSILDGAITIDRLIDTAKRLGMPGVALTDHGNMFGALEFYQKAKKKGITPVLGQEFYIAPGSRFDRDSRANGRDSSYHLILLARNTEGYKNLLKLSSIGYIEGFYYKPRIDYETLQKHCGGLICSTACIGGEIPTLILQGKLKEAEETAGKMNELFGRDNFYLELQDHGLPEQKIANRELVAISERLNIPLIATNDCHYLNKEDAYPHEVLLCIQTGKTLDDENRMRFSSDQFYLKSGEEMFKLFGDYPDALYNTRKICEMTDVEIELYNPILPNFTVPEGYTLDSYLKKLVFDGAALRYGGSIPTDVLQRIEYELSVITKMKFSGYFLIVWDFINYAKSKKIPVGPGRGSAAGSIVSYCLGITSLDPLKYNLLFERFLNPDRNEMPDMDIDFCAERREEVIDYVKQKYGEDRVSQIITYNRMKSRAVIKDVARVLNIPFAEANDISKLIMEDSLTEALNNSAELKKLAADAGRGKSLIDISLVLEGLVRSAGKHAAGVVISREPLTEYVPLYRDTKDGSISSQYDKISLEAAGLVKMDFLGLKNLTIIDKCLKLIEKTTGEKLDISAIPLDDAETFSLLQKSNTKGVFQLESAGMQNILRKLGPTEFEDIIAINALYRPGPLNSGMVDDFITRKRNPKKVKYLHPSLEPVLKDTLGVIVYQEQVMLISQVMGGFTLPEADKLRKAMGKKKVEIIDQMEEKFLRGAKEKKIDATVSKNMYGIIREFGEYGFNKSHSAAYALVSYQTAYLKAHYPLAYMASLLSAQPDNTDDVVKYVNDCKAGGIQVLPPDINHSELDFTIEDGSIRFGLKAIKGLGEKAIESIVQARREAGAFASLRDFLENVDILTVNKGVIESLAKAGAFDTIHDNRAQISLCSDILIDTARRLQEDKASGQGNLFDSGPSGGAGAPIELPPVQPWHTNEKLFFEKEVLGLYMSGHPLAKYEKEIKAFSCTSIGELGNQKGNGDYSIVGIVSNLRVRTSKNGKRFAMGVIEDMDGSIEALFFPDIFSRCEKLLSDDAPVMVRGSVEFEDEKPRKIIVNEIKSLRDIRRDAITSIHIRIDTVGMDDEILFSIKNVITDNSGACPVFFHIIESRGSEQIVRAHQSFNISPTETCIAQLTQIVGEDAVRFSARNC